MELYNAAELYPGFAYPAGLEKIAELDLVDLDIWFVMDAAFAARYIRGLATRYPDRKLVPFAKRTDNDDVACFEVGTMPHVQIIHDFADPGWEQRGEFADVWAWFSSAVGDLIAYARDEE